MDFDCPRCGSRMRACLRDPDPVNLSDAMREMSEKYGPLRRVLCPECGYDFYLDREYLPNFPRTLPARKLRPWRPKKAAKVMIKRRVRVVRQLARFRDRCMGRRGRREKEVENQTLEREPGIPTANIEAGEI